MVQLSLQDYWGVLISGLAFAVKLEQELFKSQSASEGNGGGDASGEVSIKPGSFHNLQAENTTHLPVRKGAVNLVQITTLLVVVC